MDIEAKLALRRLVDAAKFLEPGREGGFFSVWHESECAFTLPPVLIGIVSDEKRERYQRLSREKAVRLYAHPHHLLSSESRDPHPAFEHFGGAFRAGQGVIYSFSGFSEEMDEALMMAVACVTRLKTFAQCCRAIGVSGLDRDKVYLYFTCLIRP